MQFNFQKLLNGIHAKSIFAGLAFLSTGLLAQAQNGTANNPAQGNAVQDTTHRMGFHHHRPYNGSDSSHRMMTVGSHRFQPGRDQATDRFHRGEDGGRNAWGNGRNGWGEGRGNWAEGRHRQHGFGRPGRDRRHGRGMGQERWVRYSPEQRKQIQTINTEYRRKQQDLYKNDKMTLGEYKSQLAVLGKDKKAKMQALLTPEQKDRIEKIKRQGAENAQVRAAANLERMKIRLNLSEEQATRIRTAQVSLREQMKSIRENDNLLPQQKMEQMKALAMKRHDVVKSVLTPEQLSKFEAMHTHRWGGGEQDRSFQN